MFEAKQNTFGKLILEAHFILHSLYEAQKGILYRESQSIAAGNVSFEEHFGYRELSVLTKMSVFQRGYLLSRENQI